MKEPSYPGIIHGNNDISGLYAGLCCNLTGYQSLDPDSSVITIEKIIQFDPESDLCPGLLREKRSCCEH